LKHEVLPLARNDDMGAIDIIRVSLKVGVRFVANLLCHKEVAFPEIGLGGSTISKEPGHPATQMEGEALDWAEKELARAEERGVFSPFSSAVTMRKAMLVHKPEEYPRWRVTTRLCNPSTTSLALLALMAMVVALEYISFLLMYRTYHIMSILSQ
jgi:hypothetical protein